MSGRILLTFALVACLAGRAESAPAAAFSSPARRCQVEVVHPERGERGARFIAWLNAHPQQAPDSRPTDERVLIADVDNDGQDEYVVITWEGSGGFLGLWVYRPSGDGWTPMEVPKELHYATHEFVDPLSNEPTGLVRFCGSTYVVLAGGDGPNPWREAYLWQGGTARRGSARGLPPGAAALLSGALRPPALRRSLWLPERRPGFVPAAARPSALAVDGERPGARRPPRGNQPFVPRARRHGAAERRCGECQPCLAEGSRHQRQALLRGRRALCRPLRFLVAARPCQGCRPAIRCRSVLQRAAVGGRAGRRARRRRALSRRAEGAHVGAPRHRASRRPLLRHGRLHGAQLRRQGLHLGGPPGAAQHRRGRRGRLRPCRRRQVWAQARGRPRVQHHRGFRRAAPVLAATRRPAARFADPLRRPARHLAGDRGPSPQVANPRIPARRAFPPRATWFFYVYVCAT